MLSTAHESLAPRPSSEEALRHAVAALDAAELKRQPLAMTQALAQVARGCQGLGELRAAESHLAPAEVWAAASGATDLWVQVLCQRAECACALGEQQRAEGGHHAGHTACERARDAAFEAAHLASRVSDPTWERAVLLRVSDVLNRCGDHEDAARLQARALAMLLPADMQH
jgi:hypothetical protein